jgi:very-short-patch-repair endonuclease
MKHSEITYDRTMYYNAKQETKERAKELRKNMTDSETRVWEIVRNKKIMGLKFRRQHPIDIYIVDFFCYQLKLVVEVDGDIHNRTDQSIWDKNRTSEIESFGIEVIRFTNFEVMNQPDVLTMSIKMKCEEILDRKKFFTNH